MVGKFQKSFQEKDGKILNKIVRKYVHRKMVEKFKKKFKAKGDFRENGRKILEKFTGKGRENK